MGAHTIIVPNNAFVQGSHDEALEDHDPRPLYPTSAQIHYETVMKLQQPPPAVKTREAETQMKDVREAGTSMEGREGLDSIQERLARGRTDLSREEGTGLFSQGAWGSLFS